jgi:hypothetical protein
VSKQSADEFVRSSNDGTSSQQKSLASSSSSSSNNADGSGNGRSTGAPSVASANKGLLDQQDLIKQEPSYSNYLPNTYKSRVLLSYDDHEQHFHGPYLPASSKQKFASHSQQHLTAAPSYTYSNSVEKYMNKKYQSAQNDEQMPSSE